MSPTVQTIFAVINIVGPILTLVATAFMWRMRGEFASKNELAAVEQARQLLHDRLEKVESAITHLPDADALHELALKLTTFIGNMNTLEAKLSGAEGRLDAKIAASAELARRIELQVNRLEDFLRRAAP